MGLNNPGQYEPPPGSALQELLWIHSLIRRDLETVQRLARETEQGASPAHVSGEIEQLATRGPLWTLRVNCLYYCRFVHGHHGLEDAALFPAVRRADPGLESVVDRLERDHLRISGNLDAIESSARALGVDDAAATRQQLVRDLDALAEHLLDHLAYEERSLAPVLEGLTIEALLRE